MEKLLSYVCTLLKLKRSQIHLRLAVWVLVPALLLTNDMWPTTSLGLIFYL